MTADPRPTRHARVSAGRSPVALLLDFVGNVWFGITMLVLVLIYCWIGSAGTAPFYDWFVRQSFEKTELEWFTWWPFVVLNALLCLSLVIVTIRRIPFNAPNAGVWVTHIGILVLVGGCMIYFGLKKEGDALVFRRAVVLSVADGDPVSMTLRPGAAAHVRGAGVSYRVQVVNLNPDYELLTGEDAGQETLAAQLLVEPETGSDTGEPFIRQLLAGYPQYTEDVVPGEGRAINARGTRLLDDRLDARLEYEPARKIFLHDRRALHVRPLGTEAWAEAALDGLPRYSEHVSLQSDVILPPSEGPFRLRSIDLAPRWPGRENPLGSEVDVRVTGFLPFATLDESWEPGGETFNPLARFRLRFGQIVGGGDVVASMRHPLHVPVGNMVLDVGLRWIDDPRELARTIEPAPATLEISLDGGSVVESVPVARAAREAVSLGGTGYSVEIVDLYPHWSADGRPGPGNSSMVLVRVTRGDESFLRGVVTPEVERSVDLDAEGERLQAPADDRIAIRLDRYVPPGLTIVAGPLGLYAVVSNGRGLVDHLPAEIGRPVVFPQDGMELTIEGVSPNSRSVERAVVIPRSQRNFKARSAMSLVQLSISEPGRTQRIWVPYSHYTFESRAGYSPRRVALRDGRVFELVYSRETIPLPTPVALEDFELETYPGGSRERDFISHIRFLEQDGWSETHEVRSNQPTEYAGWWFFQSTWDPPDPERGHAGMNFTGLGIGNRHGVLVMLAGGALTVLGTLWAFYVKPVLLRRRRDRLSRRLGDIDEHGGQRAADVRQRASLGAR
jgi:hypothetical protein